MRRFIALSVLTLALVAVFACKKKEEAPPPEVAPPAPAATTEVAPPTTPAPLAVGTVTTGTAIGADKKVTTPSTTFATTDKTIYASVDTTGEGHAKLRALWSYVKGDKTTQVNETTMEFDATGPATNEFHVDNTKAWPKGDYKVEIFLNDGAAPAATTTFKVQ